jgi:hypothetical protein
MSEGLTLIENWYRRPQIWIALGVFLLTLGVYVETLPPTSSFWDCGEFITSSHIVGVPHQPGTPLYVLVGRVFDILLGSPDTSEPALRTAWALNFMSAFFSALAVMMVYLLVWELARRADPDSGWLAHIGGVVGALFLAFSETYWNNAIEAEVYGLAAFMMGLLCWLSIRWYDHRTHGGSDNLLLLMVYLLGLGVGFHLGTLLVYPGIFVMVFFASRRKIPFIDLLLMSVGLLVFMLSTSIRNDTVVQTLLVAYSFALVFRAVGDKPFALKGSLLFFVGLTVHVMMLIRAGADPSPFINQTEPDSFERLMTVIRREQYPALNPFDRQAPLLWQFSYYYKFLLQQFHFVGNGTGMFSLSLTVLGPIFLAMLGLAHGLTRLRPLIFLPLVNYIINGEFLTLYLNFTNPQVRDRDYFYFAAFLFFAVFIGLGAAALLRYVAGKSGLTAEEAEEKGTNWKVGFPTVKFSPRVAALSVVLLVVCLMPLTPASEKYFDHDRSDNRIAVEYAWNILAGLDENSIIFTNGDNDTFPIWYLQAVEKFRTDVTVVNLSLINLDWYIKQLKHAPEPLAMSFTDREIDKLEHYYVKDPRTGYAMRDPETGLPVVHMIKDDIVDNIIEVNDGPQGEHRPVFFAVTIPQDNVGKYFSKLQMEGMAYRLTPTDGANGMPKTDGQKVLENMLGVYDMASVMTGDSPQRMAEYTSMTDQGPDNGNEILGQSGENISPEELAELRLLLGKNRSLDPETRMFQSQNARYLLGNYHAAFNRAGIDFLIKAEEIGRSNRVLYKEYIDNALTAFRASLDLAPFNEQALWYYPDAMMLTYQDKETVDFLDSLDGNVALELEEELIKKVLSNIRPGSTEFVELEKMLYEWVSGKIENNPNRQFYYYIQLSLLGNWGRIAECEEVVKSWEAYSGESAPAMHELISNYQALHREREKQKKQNAGGE